jgi:hypothetical protein
VLQTAGKQGECQRATVNSDSGGLHSLNHSPGDSTPRRDGWRQPNAYAGHQTQRELRRRHFAFSFQTGSHAVRLLPHGRGKLQTLYYIAHLTPPAVSHALQDRRRRTSPLQACPSLLSPWPWRWHRRYPHPRGHCSRAEPLDPAMAGN